MGISQSQEREDGCFDSKIFHGGYIENICEYREAEESVSSLKSKKKGPPAGFSFVFRKQGPNDVLSQSSAPPSSAFIIDEMYGSYASSNHHAFSEELFHSKRSSSGVRGLTCPDMLSARGNRSTSVSMLDISICSGWSTQDQLIFLEVLNDHPRARRAPDEDFFSALHARLPHKSREDLETCLHHAQCTRLAYFGHTVHQ